MAWFVSIPFLRTLAWRTWWLLLVLVHVPAIASVGRAVLNPAAEGPGPVMSVAVCLCVLFFFLKLIDVRFLRLGAPRNGVLAFILAFTLVHYDVTVTVAGSEAMRHMPAALMTVLFAEGLRRGTTAWSGVRGDPASARRRAAATRRLWTVLEDPFTPPQRLAAVHVCGPRAPPTV